MSTELVPVNNKVQSIRQLLEKSKSQIKMALPAHLSPDRMMRIAMTSIQRNPDLLKCTPTSLIGAVIQSAQLGLEPDNILGHAYLIPYGTVCTFQAGYKGLLKLARQSGEISTVMVEVVHAKDHFKFQLGLDPILEHIPTEDEDEGPMVAAYAVAKLKDGGAQFVVMRKAAIEKIRAQSPSAKKGPWVTHTEEMWKKTAFKRLAKWLPCSVELERAIALDERADVGLPQDIEIELEPESQPTPVSRLDALANAQDAVDTVAEICDAEDWRDIETMAGDMKVKMPVVISHVMGTMGFKPAEKLTKARKAEVIAWINAQKK